MNRNEHDAEMAKNAPQETYDVMDVDTGDKLGEVDVTTFLGYLEDIGTDEVGAVDGADYGFDGHDIWMEP